jgi:hypothetical protein
VVLARLRAGVAIKDRPPDAKTWRISRLLIAYRTFLDSGFGNEFPKIRNQYTEFGYTILCFWAFDTSQELGVGEITIVGATYPNLGNLNLAIGADEADSLHRPPHEYEAGGLRVRGVTSRGNWYVRGVVIVAWAHDDVLGQVEGQRPAAIAAVVTVPDYIPAWRAAHHPERIGQVRAEDEAEFSGGVVAQLDPRAATALDRAAAWVNDAHQTLDGSEREAVAGVLVALREARVPVDDDGLRARLMARGWNGGLINATATLASRVAKGETPRHRPTRLG